MLPLVLISLVGLAAFGGGSVMRFVGLRRQAAGDPGAIAVDLPVDSGWTPPLGRRARSSGRSRSRVAARLLRRPSAGTMLFVVTAVGYALLGVYLVRQGSIVGDAESRVADAWYVLFSRDPHVAAIGFVWNPLPSALAGPFLLLKGVFPIMARRAFAGVLVSAVCMAGSVVQVRAAVRELGAGPVLGKVLVAAYALNPMVVYYGANGMSEAAYLLFLAVTVRYLARWVGSRALTDLVWAGMGLGFCYLARYEAALAALGTAAVVLAIHLVGGANGRKKRVRSAIGDLIVVLAPFTVAFVGWAVTSQVITGNAFEQFQSQYGNSSQVRLVGAANLPGHGTGWPLPVFVVLQMLAFAPLLPLVGVAGGLLGWRRRDLRVLAPLFVIGAVMVFTAVSFCAGETFGWLRFQLPVAVLSPMCLALLFGPALPGAGAAGSDAVPPSSRPRRRRPRLAAGVLAGSLIAVAAVPTSAWAMFDRRLGVGERPQLEFVVHPHHLTASEQQTKAIPTSAARLAARFDALHLAPGSVVTDTFTPCVSLMLMDSDNPHQFVITSDRDFQPTLADPVLFGAHYLLVPQDAGYGTLDAVNDAYPTLYDKGAPFARRVATFREPGCPSMRLYRIIGSTGGG